MTARYSLASMDLLNAQSDGSKKEKKGDCLTEQLHKAMVQKIFMGHGFLAPVQNLDSCLAVLWLVIKFDFILILQREIQFSQLYFMNI